MIDHAVSKLVTYALRTGLIEECEVIWATNTILDVLKLDTYKGVFGHVAFQGSEAWLRSSCQYEE